LNFAVSLDDKAEIQRDVRESFALLGALSLIATNNR